MLGRIAVILSLCICVQSYAVSAVRANADVPIMTSQDMQQSVFLYNYNAAWLPLYDANGVESDAMIVRCQNLVNESNPYQVTPSVFAVSYRSSDPLDPANLTFSDITLDDVIIQPENASDALGTEDPRLVYRASTGMYYLMFTEVSQDSNGVAAHLSLATSMDPTNADAWERRGYLFPQLPWSKSGALLIRDGFSGPSYLFWGDSAIVCGLQVATTINLIDYTYNASVWMPCREDNFDSDLVEAGPMPLPLSDGNYLFIYNSARHGYPSQKPNWDLQYNPGWVVLNGSDPTQIIQRCEDPLMSPVWAWEIGAPPYLGLTPNVVFIEGWRPLGDDQFLAIYGAADSVVGSAVITVTTDSEGRYIVRADR